MIRVIKVFLALFFCLNLTACDFTSSPPGNITYINNLKIHSNHATLSANIYQPKPLQDKKRYPAVIFLNSWGLNEYEMKYAARHLASKGYIVLSYSLRGWGKSTGVVDAGGPNDLKDISNVITWLTRHKPINAKHIALSGISYGAGLSLLGAEHDRRISAVIAMSGWSNLLNTLYFNETPSITAVNALLLSAKIVRAHLSPNFHMFAQQFSAYDLLPASKLWALRRSPITYINKLNHRPISIFLSNNYQDFIFNPGDMLDFYNKLKINNKVLYLNQGTHASAEASVITGKNNPLWDKAYHWLDKTFKINNNTPLRHPALDAGYKRNDVALGRNARLDSGFRRNDVREVTGNQNINSQQAIYIQPGLSPNNKYQLFDSQGIVTKHFYLHPRSNNKYGTLSPTAYKITSTNSINKGDSGVSSGGSSSAAIQLYKLVRDVKNQTANVPVISLSNVDRHYAAFYIYFQKEKNHITKIRGVAKVKLWVELPKPPLQNIKKNSVWGQVVAYLYDINPKTNKARLITYAPKTIYAQQLKNNNHLAIQFPLHLTAYNLPAGHHLGLALTAQDPLFESPMLKPLTKYPLIIDFGRNMSSEVSVPIKS